MAGSRLQARSYRRPAPALARALLGARIVCGARSGVIVETEAYLGPDDAASHARFGVTPRNRIMYGPAGVSYVYLCYGVHQMFNVVSDRDGQAGAVLVRAVEVDGEADARAGAGPGKLTRALGIGAQHNQLDLTRSEALHLLRARRFGADRVAVGSRIGVDYAGTWAAAPLRFWVDGHPSVSRAGGGG